MSAKRYQPTLRGEQFLFDVEIVSKCFDVLPVLVFLARKRPKMIYKSNLELCFRGILSDGPENCPQFLGIDNTVMICVKFEECILEVSDLLLCETLGRSHFPRLFTRFCEKKKILCAMFSFRPRRTMRSRSEARIHSRPKLGHFFALKSLSARCPKM